MLHGSRFGMLAEDMGEDEAFNVDTHKADSMHVDSARDKIPNSEIKNNSNKPVKPNRNMKPNQRGYVGNQAQQGNSSQLGRNRGPKGKEVLEQSQES